MRIKTKGGIGYEVTPYQGRYWQLARLGKDGTPLAHPDYYHSVEGLAAGLLQLALTRKDRDSLLELVHIARSIQEDVKELRWVER